MIEEKKKKEEENRQISNRRKRINNNCKKIVGGGGDSRANRKNACTMAKFFALTYISSLIYPLITRVALLFGTNPLLLSDVEERRKKTSKG
jgi:hypothetical protein